MNNKWKSPEELEIELDLSNKIKEYHKKCNFCSDKGSCSLNVETIGILGSYTIYKNCSFEKCIFMRILDRHNFNLEFLEWENNKETLLSKVSFCDLLMIVDIVRRIPKDVTFVNSEDSIVLQELVEFLEKLLDRVIKESIK